MASKKTTTAAAPAPVAAPTPAAPSFTPGDLSKAQAQTANMDAAAYNTAHASDPGRIAIKGGNEVGSQGTIGEQTLSPASLSTPSSSGSLLPQASPSIAASSPTVSPSPSVIAGNTASGSNPIGAAPMGSKSEKVKSFTDYTNPTSTDGGAVKPSEQLSLIQIRDRIKAENPTLRPLETMQKARAEWTASNLRTTANPSVPNAPIKTGIAELDDPLNKLRDEKALKIKDTFQNYALQQADYKKKAGYYTNFDQVNGQFSGIMGDIQQTLTATGQNALNDAQVNAIAQKYGTTADNVKNPLNVFNSLDPTEEGKRVMGITARENQITDLTTKNDRDKQDLADNFDLASRNINNQIDDTQKNLQRDMDWLTASGAWSGAANSSGFQVGMNNVKNDANTIINRLHENLATASHENTKQVGRIGQDYTTNMTRLKTSLDDDVKTLKFDLGLKLNTLESTYGKSSKTLLNALDAIQAEFGTKSQDVMKNYLANVSSIQGITAKNLDLLETYQKITDAQGNKRYTDLLSQNGAILQNTKLTDILGEVASGKITMEKYQNLKNVMLTSITSTLQKTGLVTQEDINTVDHLLQNGSTPAQALAYMQGQTKFKPTGVNAGVGTGTIPGGLGDMSALGYDTNGNPKLNGFAWAKNNNSSGITWNANFENPTPGSLAYALKQKGIQFEKGTARPPEEGGNYVKFATMDDGIEAVRTLWEISAQNGQSINDRLKNYSVAGYTLPGVDGTKKFTDLDKADQDKLILLQIKKESPKLLEELQKRGGGIDSATQGTARTFTPTEKAIMDDYEKNPSDPKNQTAMKTANLGSVEFNAYKTPKATNGDLTQDTDLRTARLATNIYGKTASDNESKRILKIISNNPNATDNDIIDAAMGFTIDPKYKDISNGLRNIIFQNPDVDPKSVLTPMGRLLNQGKTTEAMNMAENSALDVARKNNPGFDTSEAGTIFATKNANKVLDLMTQYEDKFGTLNGKWEDYTKGFFGDADAQKLATSITQAIAAMRKDLVGSNITAGEKTALENLIPRLDESAETAKEKVMNLKTSPLAQYNSLRASAFLPEVDETTLLDKNERAKMYSNGTSVGQSTPSSTPKTEDPADKAMLDYISNINK